MNAKISVFFICVEAMYICYHTICMAVPLIKSTQTEKIKGKLNIKDLEESVELKSINRKRQKKSS